MSKQTAVEWLIEMISYTSKDTHSAMESSNFFEQAMAMEREQIEDAYINSETAYHSNDDAKEMAEHYYEQTYGKEPSHEG